MTFLKSYREYIQISINVILSISQKWYLDKIPLKKSLRMPLIANLLKLESSILTRAKRATNRNDVATKKRSYIFFSFFFRGDFILEPSEMSYITIYLANFWFQSQVAWTKLRCVRRDLGVISVGKLRYFLRYRKQWIYRRQVQQGAYFLCDQHTFVILSLIYHDSSPVES